MRYGTARDLCVGMQVALAGGTLARGGGKVVKNVAGYDLNKLHIGALGTVGVITEATFKLWPAPEARGAIVAAFDSLDEAHAAAMQLLNGRLFPAAVELAGRGAAQRLATEARFEIRPEQWLLAVLMLGVPRAVERQAEEAGALCIRSGAIAASGLNEGGRDALFAGLRDFGRSAHNRASLIVRAAVLPSQTARAVGVLESLGQRISTTPEVLCRPSAGLVFGFWQELSEAGLASAVTNARQDLAALSGTLVVERAPVGALAGIDVWGLDGPDLRLMRRLKETYDPSGTLSPGRYVNGL
jgi:glycolate oxidase FAD binding subunit